MKKILLSGGLMFGFISGMFAQNMSGAFVTPAVPVGSLTNYSSIGIGVGGQSRFFPLERLATGFNATFHYYFGRPGTSNFVVVPVRGTVEYWFTDEGARFRPFVGLDLGVYIATYANSVRFRFGMAPGAGCSFELSDEISIQVQMRYNFLFDAGVKMIFEPSIGFSYTFY